MDVSAWLNVDDERTANQMTKSYFDNTNPPSISPKANVFHGQWVGVDFDSQN